MNYEEKALDLIAQPENIAAAVEIAELVELLKPRFQAEFWKAVTARTEQLLAASELNATWKIVPPKEPFHEKWVMLSLMPMVVTPNCRVTWIGLQQGRPNEDFTLYYGITWGEEFPGWQNISELANFSKDLKIQGFTNSNNWWPGWKYLGIKTQSHDFMQTMATNREAFVDELATNLLRLLQENIDQINAVNEALKNYPRRPA